MTDLAMNDPRSFINQIEVAVPKNDGHQRFVAYLPKLVKDDRHLRVLTKLASKCQIDHRYSVLNPSPDPAGLDGDGFFEPGQFASTSKRMERYRREALPLAEGPVGRILEKTAASEISHLIVTSCTGFYAPGLDLELQKRFGMRSGLERTMIGFMGCYAAFNGMKAARHIVTANPAARVMMVNLELCSLHLQETDDMEELLAFMQFADGCAASLISGERYVLELERFRCEVIPEGEELIRWGVGDMGFDMSLSMEVPQALGHHLPDLMPKIVSPEERAALKLWAVHPGGRSILDAVQSKLGVTDAEMEPSRSVLRDFGNMSSATIMFVLKQILSRPEARGPGIAMAFGPGLTLETVLFNK